LKAEVAGLKELKQRVAALEAGSGKEAELKAG